MTVRMKRGVVLFGSSPQLFEIIDAARVVYAMVGKEVVITSGIDGTHSIRSLHYRGLALDLRTRHLSDDERLEVEEGLRAKLGADFDVVFEFDHFHVEYDPKPR